MSELIPMSDLKKLIQEFRRLREEHSSAAFHLREFSKKVLMEHGDGEDLPTGTQALTDKALSVLQQLAFIEIGDSK